MNRLPDGVMRFVIFFCNSMSWNVLVCYLCWPWLFQDWKTKKKTIWLHIQNKIDPESNYYFSFHLREGRNGHSDSSGNDCISLLCITAFVKFNNEITLLLYLTGFCFINFTYIESLRKTLADEGLVTRKRTIPVRCQCTFT